ncbi:S8 family serine peptidase [Methylococcus sp. EFPC2]|uniref:S8 family serine peptidase n=1 Tax=Methylococcus sp. EFPC2 TaxID=2812648 RepID=UPI001F072431|nr:S8 family serine peptidase [Methylococcus sp. EFPC2]
MNSRTNQPISVCLAAAVSAILGLAFATTADAAPDKWAEGRILVQPRAGLPDGEFDAILSKHGARSQGRLPQLDVHVVEVPAKAEAAIVKALSKNPHVKFAELDGLIGPNQTTPNDPKFPNAWHLAKIQAPTAWDASRGANVTVAILDSGVEATHPDLAGQLLPGWNVVSNNGDTSDTRGHGTAVAGTVGAASNNSTGVTSVAWNVKLLPIRITNSADGFAYYSDIAKGLTWAADNGADVANISYEVNQVSTVTSAAQYMRGKGGLVVVSAGNGSTDPGYADNPYIISVSATDTNDTKASWSNYGSYIDVAAPGNYIWTTSPGGGYGQWYGTSFSAPTVAGVVALIKSANPALTPDQVEKVLEVSGDDIAGTDFYPYFGWGRVNAAKAVQLASQTQATDTQAPSVSVFSPTAGTTVKGLVSVDVNAADNVGVAQVALYAGSQLVGTDTVAPYQFTWDSSLVADGNATLTAKAYDAQNNQGVSSGVTVTVDNVANVADTTPPTVTFVSPANNSNVGTKVTISVIGQDNVVVASLKLYIDGALKSTVTSGSMSYTWNTRNVAKGSHTLKAVATDPAGNQAAATETIFK